MTDLAVFSVFATAFLMVACGALALSGWAYKTRSRIIVGVALVLASITIFIANLAHIVSAYSI